MSNGQGQGGSQTTEPRWGLFHTIVLGGLTLGVFSTGLLAPMGLGWIIVMIFLAAFCGVAGQGVTGVVLGVLIDDRNKMTLSRMQLLLWTVIVLSAYLIPVLQRIVADTPPADPLAVAVPAQLWVLMGISTTSLVGSPLILGTKAQKEPKKKDMTASVQAFAAHAGMTKQAATDQKGHRGLVDINAKSSQASLADMFRGDEVGDFAHLDLGKIQMLFFTLVLACAYCVQLWVLFTDPAGGMLLDGAALPALPDGMLSLLGISHAGYLTAKATPKTRIEN